MSQAATTMPQLPPFEHTPAPYTGPSRDEVVAMRREFLSPGLRTYYRDPMMLVEGKMQYLYDETGRRYLDGLAGIVTVSVGHCHPKVLEATRKQNELLQHATTIYLHPNIAEFAKKLVSTFPKESGLSQVYFTNSGSEANDLAVLMARAYTGTYDVVALRNAYHGGSQAAMGLTGHSTWKFDIPHNLGVKHAVAPDCYRGPYGYDDPDAGAKYAADVQDLIRFGTSGRVAAFICEPIQGVGGTLEVPPGYLKHVYEHVRAAGGLCIADEVQTGFGRTGDDFWGHENHGVTPDIVTMAKGIGNGCPIGAVVTRPEIAEAMTQRTHFNTFGGNPVCMAQGLATLNVLLDEHYQQKAKERGAQLRAGLDDLKQRYPIVGDVRGRGLMLGLELVKDRATKEPAGEATMDVLHRCRDLGLLVGKGGFYTNVLRIKPPMCLTADDIDFMIEVLDVALAEVAG